MRIFNVAIVIVMIAIGAALLFLSFRAYRQTGNALLIIYGSIIAIGMVSGGIAAWRNLRRPTGD